MLGRARPVYEGSAAAAGTAIGWGIQALMKAIEDHPEEPSKEDEQDDQDGNDPDCVALYVQCYEQRWARPPYRCDNCLHFCTTNGYWPYDRCSPEWASFPSSSRVAFGLDCELDGGSGW